MEQSFGTKFSWNFEKSWKYPDCSEVLRSTLNPSRTVGKQWMLYYIMYFSVSPATSFIPQNFVPEMKTLFQTMMVFVWKMLKIQPLENPMLLECYSESCVLNISPLVKCQVKILHVVKKLCSRLGRVKITLFQITNINFPRRVGNFIMN